MRRPYCGSLLNDHAKVPAYVDNKALFNSRNAGKLGSQSMSFQCFTETKDKLNQNKNNSQLIT